MSEVNAKDTAIINGLDDVLPTYQGAGADMKTGLEIELAFFNPADPNLAPMTVPQNKVVKNAAAARLPGDWVRNEPTAETLELISIAAPLSDLKSILTDTQQKINTLTDKAKNIGLKRSYFQHLPEKTAPELFKNLVNLERYRAFFGPPREDMLDIAAYFAVCKSNQISISYRDTDHMLRDVRRLYFLAPFLYMITDNTASFDQGRRITGHAPMQHRAALKDRGGVPPYVFTAKTGDEYIRNHIDHVMNNPLYVYYDENSKLQRIPSGQWSSFNKLRENGLNNAANYWLAETVLWPDVKIAALKDQDAHVVNHRYEARMFGVGIHQHQSALLIVAALANNDNFAAQIDLLLSAYGFSAKDLETSRKNLAAAYEAARNHNGRFMNVDYGTGTMAEFAQKFAGLLEAAYDGQGLDDELQPILTICRTGCTDAKINRLLFPTLESALQHQRTYDDSIFKTSNANARMVYEREIRHQDLTACARN